MRPVARHLSAALATTLVLTWVRGGFRDAPLVLGVFAVLGFAGSMGVTNGARWLDRWDRASRGSPTIVRRRSVLAGLWALGTLVWAGPAIVGAGLAGWLVLLVLLAFAPMIASLLAFVRPAGFGILTVSSVLASLALHLHFSHWGGHEVSGSRSFYPVAWLAGVAFSCATSIPLQMRRRRMPGRGEQGGGDDDR